MAASAAVAPPLTGPPRLVEVVAGTPTTLYLSTGDPARPALCLATSAAIRVPCALVVDRLPQAAPGIVGFAGLGSLTLPGFAGRVARWWAPPRPRLGSPDQLGSLLSRRVRAPLVPMKDLSRFVGRGPGLTPLGDDIVAGLLVTLRALGAHDRADAVAAQVLPRAGATTFVSAALLHHAARGECVPELARALTAPSDESVGALLGVGHSSGYGLAYGVRLGLRLT